MSEFNRIVSELPDVWKHIEERWPCSTDAGLKGYINLVKKAENLLANAGIELESFSHFGFVVNDADQVLEYAAGLSTSPQEQITRAWVKAYEVAVSRTPLQEIELELLEPKGPSRFADFLNARGEGIHHLSFQVADITSALTLLKQAGVPLIDNEPRAGSHGAVAFAAPKELAPYNLEICQPTHE